MILVYRSRGCGLTECMNRITCLPASTRLWMWDWMSAVLSDPSCFGGTELSDVGRRGQITGKERSSRASTRGS